MAYLGNINGPRESIIIESLGRNYFGISPSQFESDIEWYEDSERRGEVQPLHVDEDGRPYIVFSRPNNQTSHFYLEDKWMIKGEIKTYTTEEYDRWNR